MNARIIKLLGVVFFLVLGAAGYFLVYIPFDDNRSTLQSQLEQAEDNRTTFEQQIALYSQSRDLAPAVANYDELLNRRFPSTATPDNLRAEISMAANISGVSELTITSSVPELATPTAPPVTADPASPAGEGEEGLEEGAEGDETDPDAPAGAVDPTAPAGVTTSNDLASFTVGISAQGSMSAVINFARSMQDMERSLRIESMSIGSAGEEGYTITIEGITFLYRPIPVPVFEDSEEAAPEVDENGEAMEDEEGMVDTEDTEDESLD